MGTCANIIPMLEAPTGGMVVAVCAGDIYGGFKTPVEDGAKLKRDLGIVGDADARGGSLFQVRMLAEESVLLYYDTVIPGQHGENILTRGVDLSLFEHGTLLRIGDAAVQLTWQGRLLKKYKLSGEDISMSDVFSGHGVFLTVLKTGRVRPGDRISVLVFAGDE